MLRGLCFSRGLIYAIVLSLLAAPLKGQDVRLISDNARGALNTASLLRSLEDSATPQDVIAAARADYRRLLTALYAEGYYGGTVSITIDGTEAASLSPLAAPQNIEEVVINVTPGQRFRFGQVSIGPLPPETQIGVDLGPRRTARSGRISEAVSTSIQSWRDIGYAKTQVVDQRIIARHGNATLDVTIALDTGPQLRFGQLAVSEGGTIRPDRVRQIAGLPVGTIFSPSEVEAAATRLRRTGTFNSVTLVEADTPNPDDTLTVTAQLDEATPRRFGFGAELGSVDGLTLSSFWLHRNFLGGAERFRTEAEVAGIAGQTGGTDYRLGARLTRPATFGPDTDFFIGADISREDTPEYLLDKIEFQTGFTRILGDGLTARLAFGLLRAAEETALENRDYTLLTLPSGLEWDRRDDARNAKSGTYVDLGATPFTNTDGAISGLRLASDIRAYLSPGQDGPLTLAGRVQLGSILGADASEAPADFLFYSGGGGTVRGQGFQSLGLPSGTGGTSFSGAQLEARYGVSDAISLVGFYDVGSVGDTAIPGENSDWHAGAGLGIRYNTGIGPIRLDLATPASGDDAFSSVEFYIGIGQAF